MEEQKISPNKMLSYCFTTLFNNFGFWLGLIFTQIAILILTLAVFGGTSLTFILASKFTFLKSSLLILSLFLITMYIVSVLLTGAIQIGLDFYDTGSSSLSRLWPTDMMVPFNFLIASLLYSAMVSIGLMFFVIPGIYLGIKFWFFAQIIVDKHVGPLAALGESSRLTQPYLLEMLMTTFIITLITALPFLGITMALLCNCYAYRQLSPKLFVNEKPETSLNKGIDV